MTSKALLRSRLVLIVEDNDEIRDALIALVQARGLDAVGVRNGLEALEQLRWGLRPCVILLDMRMGVMTGWEFRAEQRKDPLLAAIPVVAMTSGQWKPEDATAFDHRIDKPIKPQQLQAVLDRCAGPSGGDRPDGCAEPATASAARRATRGVGPVLVVEDDAEVRTALADVLRGDGFAVECARDGRDALELLTRIVRPCLVLLDLAMPGMDGWDFLTARRKDPALRSIPVIILSAFTAKVHKLAAGASAVLAKPVDPRLLVEIARGYCLT